MTAKIVISCDGCNRGPLDSTIHDGGWFTLKEGDSFNRNPEQAIIKHYCSTACLIDTLAKRVSATVTYPETFATGRD